MPKPEYPKSRRLLMQAVLCLIFGGSVGLAAFVVHDRRVNGSSHLAGMRYVGPIGVKLPRGWLLERENQGKVVFVAVEPDSAERKGRQITIEHRKVDPTLAPEEFLQSSGLLRGTERLVPADPNTNLAESITIAGMPGVMIAVKKPIGGIPFIAQPEMETELFAASVRPSGLAISLRLDCPDDTDPDNDQQTLRDIAAAMDVQESGSGH